MKFLPLIWAGLWRARARTTLTVLSIAVAFALYGLLQGVNAGFDTAIAGARLDRLIVAPRFITGAIAPLPLAYRDEIARVPGVALVTSLAAVGGYYQTQTN